jgi:hypothetical protein
MEHQVEVRMPQDRLKATMAQLASAGPRDFYEGDLANSLAADIQAAGGALSVEDLKPFRAHLREALAIPIAAARYSRRQNLLRGQRFRACSVFCRKISSLRAAGRMRQPTSPMPRRCRRPIASA